MARNLIAILGAWAVTLSAVAQEPGYAPQDVQGEWEPGPPPSGEGYEVEAAQTEVDVDLATPGASVTFQTFHDGLAPHGEWMTVTGYGRVWRPANVGAGWRPYYYGRWEWTDEGWLWVSDEPWGWAAYHYGRWAYESHHGWVWIPGYQWAPAWVTWRYSPEYIGWAPLGPGFSVHVTSYPVVYGWWTFVPCRRFVGVPVHSVAFGGHHVRGIFHGTHPAPPRAAVFGARAPAWGGPARPFVEQRLGHSIAPVRVQPVGSPAAIASARPAGVVPIYRPEARVRAPRGASSGHGVLPPPPAQNRSAGGVRAMPAPSALRGAPAGGQLTPRAPAPGASGLRTAPAPSQGGFRAPPNQGGGGPPVNAPRAAPRPAPQPRGSLAPPSRPEQGGFAGVRGGGGGFRAGTAFARPQVSQQPRPQVSQQPRPQLAPPRQGGLRAGGTAFARPQVSQPRPSAATPRNGGWGGGGGARAQARHR